MKKKKKKTFFSFIILIYLGGVRARRWNVYIYVYTKLREGWKHSCEPPCIQYLPHLNVVRIFNARKNVCVMYIIPTKFFQRPHKQNLYPHLSLSPYLLCIYTVGTDNCSRVFTYAPICYRRLFFSCPKRKTTLWAHWVKIGVAAVHARHHLKRGAQTTFNLYSTDTKYIHNTFFFSTRREKYKRAFENCRYY